MTVRKVDQPQLDSWVDGLIADGKVIGIQSKDDKFEFAPLEGAGDLRLDYDVSLLPPKLFFQPPRETLLRFKGAQYQSVVEDEPFVLLGVHPYDMVALNQMDRIWSEDNPDAHYLARREAATVVACDVQTPSENVFAGCMNTAVVHEGYDILLTKIATGTYVVEIATPKGEAIAGPLADAPEATGDALAARAELWRANMRNLRKHQLKLFPTDLPALLERSYDHPVWEEMAEKCFACGSCNLVCPTCYCFDVEEVVDWDLESGERVRKWDGCLLTSFASVAGGHNFRRTAAERFRHRYYRKGKYVAEKIGECACVGCGRCIGACVANIANPVEVFNRLLEAK